MVSFATVDPKSDCPGERSSCGDFAALSPIALFGLPTLNVLCACPCPSPPVALLRPECTSDEPHVLLALLSLSKSSCEGEFCILPLDFLDEDRGVTLRVALLFVSSWDLTRGVTGVLLVVGSRGAAGLEGGVDVALPATRGVSSGVLAVLADASVGFSGRFVVRSEDMAMSPPPWRLH